MFLKSITLRNIRSINELTLDFSHGDAVRPWTYLLGENGCGKSTVLKSIGFVMAGGDAAVDLIGEQDSWIRLGQEEASIEARFQTADGSMRSASYRFRRGGNTRDFLYENRESMNQLDRAIEKSARNYFVVGYGVNRYGGSPDEDGSISRGRGRRSYSPRAGAVSSLFNLDTQLISLESWAMDLDYRRGEQAMSPVKHALDNLLPDVTFSHIDRDRRQLIFHTVDGDLPLSALSDGYQAIATWCGDLFFQITETFEDYSDPLRARGLLLIDEIDLHLHPIWQRELVSFIRNTLPNIQVVVTTHSPLTVHQAGENELFVVRRTPGEGSRIEAFGGAPNRLMLHQLIQSPLFGLETLDSPVVEKMRQELRDLQGIGQKSVKVMPDHEKRINELTSALEDAPDWSSGRPSLDRSSRALEQIGDILSEAKGLGASRAGSLPRFLKGYPEGGDGSASDS